METFHYYRQNLPDFEETILFLYLIAKATASHSLTRTCASLQCDFADLVIKNWHLSPHPMNDLIGHLKCGRRANMAILILRPGNFHPLSELGQCTRLV